MRNRNGITISSVVLILIFIDGARASCNFCQDGSPYLEDAGRSVFGQTCQEWKFEALNNNDGRVPCGEYEYSGKMCGCNNAPPANGCKLCPNGQDDMMYPDRRVPEFVFLGIPGIAVTCAEMQTMIQYMYDSSNAVCRVQQSVIASYCGCTEPNEMTCPLCSNGMVIDGPKRAPDFGFESVRGLSMPMNGVTCLDAEFVANAEYLVDSAACFLIQYQVSEGCCVEPSSLSASFTPDTSSAVGLISMIGTSFWLLGLAGGVARLLVSLVFWWN